MRVKPCRCRASKHSGQQGAGPAQKQRQVEAAVLEGEMTYNEALIEEREQGISEIAQQIGEVNEIFQARAWACGGSGRLFCGHGLVHHIGRRMPAVH